MPDINVSVVVMRYHDIIKLDLYFSSLSLELNSETFEVLPVQFTSNVNNTRCIAQPTKNITIAYASLPTVMRTFNLM